MKNLKKKSHIILTSSSSIHPPSCSTHFNGNPYLIYLKFKTKNLEQNNFLGSSLLIFHFIRGCLGFLMGDIYNLVFSICLIFVSIGSNEASKSGLFIGCGSSELEEDANGRSWEPDLKYISFGDKSMVAKAENQDASLPDPLPFMNARIFTSETSYMLPFGQEGNNTKRILLRLYFYPCSYPHFDVSNAYFSITAGEFTLLNNFSASITAEALSQGYIIKEYFLASPLHQSLSVTITPAPKSLAFINGIEVMQAPEVFDEDPILVGSNSGSGDHSSVLTTVVTKSMQTMYRLNVGGSYISPSTDSGEAHFILIT